MVPVPAHPKIFHITNVDNLSQILQQGKLWSDAKRIELGLECSLVGMSSIKERRLHELSVKCHPGTRVGDYVPFYFCPRSIMLYILHMANNPELTYRGGQGLILHLVADLRETVKWANSVERLWAFSNGNAGAYLTDFFADLARLDRINWNAVEATDFRSPVIKEGKQAEFLIHDSFPWHVVEKIGVRDRAMASRVQATLREAACRHPPVSVEPAWYY